MDTLPSTTSPQVAGLILLTGVALLLFGRKLYWLALGGLGLAMGLWFSQRVLQLGSRGEELALALLLGVAGALLAVFAQKLAVAVGGFLLGGYFGIWLAESLFPDPGWQLLALFLVGAVAGCVLGSALFEGVLVLISSAVGAGLIVSTVRFETWIEPWLFLFLLVLGILLQMRGRRRRRR